MAGAAPHLCESALQTLKLLEEHCKRIAQQPSEAVRPSKLAEYAQCRLQFECVMNAATTGLPAASNLFRDRSLAKLAPTVEALRTAERKLRGMEAVLFTGQRPALRDTVFLTAASELAQFEVLRLQASMTRSAQQVRRAQTLCSAVWVR